MIQIIGLMIGAYIFTRMLDLSMRKDTHTVLRWIAVLTAFFDCLMIVLLLSMGNDTAAFRPR